MSNPSDLAKRHLPVHLEFEEDDKLRLKVEIGSAEYEGEQIEISHDTGGGILLHYRGEWWRLSPQELICKFIESRNA